MECLENVKDIKKPSSRRSKKVKNLEQEVELILSQEESDDEINVEDAIIEEVLPKTPSRKEKIIDMATPKASNAVLIDILQTPRRSCRKSIKPTQEYDDIVSKSCSRPNRSMKQDFMITEEEEDHENMKNDGEPVAAQPKWTPAKVGRVSQKRSRKSRRNTKAKQNKEKKVNEDLEISPETGDDVNVAETENLVNEEIKNENMILVKPLENIKIEDKAENHRDSLKEFMEIEKHVNNIQDLNESIHLIQEESEDALGMPSEESKDVTINLVEEDSATNQDTPSEETNDVSILFIQEDSVDVKEIASKETIESNCIDLLDENTNKSIKIEQLEDSFGCYLKSKEINISDLGLNPLKDEDPLNDDGKQNIKEEDIISMVVENESEDMPSLIVCDDDDEEVAKEETNKLNETFEANDSVVIIEATSKSTATSSQDNMESLKLSDDEGGDTPKKAPRIMLTTAELQNQTLLATPNLQLPSTPKQVTKAFRFPTPYRNRHNFKFNKTEEQVETEIPKNLSNCSWMSSVTSLEPKDIVLRGIRKRSLSVCIDGKVPLRQKPFVSSLAKHNQDKMVSFYSPANQTTIIDDLDLYIAKSLKKQKKDVEIKESSNKFVTTRRKRSLSVDESLMSSSMSRLPRPVLLQSTPSKSQTLIKSSSKPLTRTKLPNFAAIHNKNFQKMENLLDHVNRKQERSKILINSNTKIRPASAQKNISLIKLGNHNIEKPKALKKIDLGVSSTKIQASAASTTSTTSTDLLKSNVKSRPIPQTGLTKVLKASVIPQRITQKVQTVAAAPQQQQIRKYLKPSQGFNNTFNQMSAASSSSSALKPKPKFNLSTSTNKPSSSVSSSMENLNKIQTTMSHDDKMASRLQRHMDLFKGRVPATRAGVASRKNEAVIRGVRSNRRFDLQMQHRKNMEN